MKYIVWNADLEEIGRYEERGDANRACRKDQPGAVVTDLAGVVLGYHPGTSKAQAARIERAGRDGKLTPAPERAPKASTPPPPAQPAPAPAAQPSAPPPAGPSLARCTWPGCDQPRGGIRANTRPEHVPYCATHRASARAGVTPEASAAAQAKRAHPGTPAATAVPVRVTTARLRDAEERFVENHPAVYAMRTKLAEAIEHARKEFHAKVRELFGADQAEAAE